MGCFFDIACRVFTVTGLSAAGWATSSFIVQQYWSVLFGEHSGDRNALCTFCVKYNTREAQNIQEGFRMNGTHQI
jgi:hypothetical protein